MTDSRYSTEVDGLRLLPCPFCGEQPVTERTGFSGRALYVYCINDNGCPRPKAIGETVEKAAENWNLRSNGVNDSDWFWTGNGSDVRLRGTEGKIAASALGLPMELPLGWPPHDKSETEIALKASSVPSTSLGGAAHPDCPCKPGKCIYPGCTCAIPSTDGKSP